MPIRPSSRPSPMKSEFLNSLSNPNRDGLERKTRKWGNMAGTLNSFRVSKNYSRRLLAAHKSAERIPGKDIGLCSCTDLSA